MLCATLWVVKQCFTATEPLGEAQDQIFLRARSGDPQAPARCSRSSLEVGKP